MGAPIKAEGIDVSKLATRKAELKLCRRVGDKIECKEGFELVFAKGYAGPVEMKLPE